jgi:preprotein translocase subunit SecB
MSDQNPGSSGSQAPDGTTGGPTIRVLSQYIKDLSFENPAAGTPLMSESPGINIGVDVNARGHAAGEGVFEVALRLSAHARSETDDPMFVCELIYGGIFELSGVSAEDAEALLLIECPRLLFPFARESMASITRDGGFPPLMIDPIDFIGLYRQKKARDAKSPSVEADESSDNAS